MFNFANAGSQFIQKVAVVRDNQQGTFIGLQVIFQPHNGLKVQMVGWFIQDQQIGFLQQKFGNGKTGLFSAAEPGNDAVICFFRESHAVQNGFQLDIDLIAVVVFEPSGKLVVFFRSGKIAVLHVLFNGVKPLLCV